MRETSTAITVGKAARKTGLSGKAIRLYERKGLLVPAERTESGYRMFGRDDLSLLRFIRQAKALGLSLEEIKDVIDLQRQGAQPCGKVIQMLDSHISQIDRTMADLRSLRSSLVRARDAARTTKRQGDEAVVCRIIESSSN